MSRFFPLVLLLLAGCARPRPAYQPLPAPAAPVGAPGTPAAPQLLFASFRVVAPAGGGAHRVELLQARTVPGLLPPSPPDEAPEPGASAVLITQLDGAGRPCGPPTRLPHPLLLEVEAPDASGQLVRRQALQPEAEFFVRQQRSPAARRVEVREEGPLAPQPFRGTFDL